MKENEKNISDFFKETYPEFALSANYRSLPSIRDGLKPVHRRILMALKDVAPPNGTTKKSAKVVGEVLSSTHPHGDMSVYDAMIRMAQNFYLNLPLIQGQGNLGSISGASPAAMRYTEVKISNFIDWLCLEGVTKGAVPLIDNYDRSRKEPIVLPVKIPLLLINGIASGSIGVGFASTFPSHNIEEIAQCCSYILECKKNKETISIKKIVSLIKGPDFPTFGSVSKDGIENYIKTGNGSIKIRGEVKEENNTLIISSIPYGTTTSKLITSILNCNKDDNEKLPEIKEIRDETTLDPKTFLAKVKIVLELKKGSNKKDVIEKLFKYSDLELSMGISLNVIDENNSVKTINVLDALTNWCDFRIETIKRQAQFEYQFFASRFHTVEGLLKIHPYINEIIEIIKLNETEESACQELVKKLNITSKQAQDIVKTRIGNLTKIKVSLLEKEAETLTEKLKLCSEIISSDQKVIDIINNDFKEIKTYINTKRKTLIL